MNKNQIVFNCNSKHRNYDANHCNDGVLTTYSGFVEQLRFNENKMPIKIGEFLYHDLNLLWGRTIYGDNYVEDFFVNHIDFFKKSPIISLFHETFDYWNYDRLIVLDYFLQKQDINDFSLLDEYVKFVVKKHHNSSVAILFVPEPNQIYDLFMLYKNVKINSRLASEYYNVSDKNELYKQTNIINHLKNIGFEKHSCGDLYFLNYEKFFFIEKNKITK
jgi:hypothetical protein